MAINLTTLTARQIMMDAAVIPVIVLHDVRHAVPLARALVAGGIRMLEVTLRTPAALACMEAIAGEVEGVVLGAGTVCNAEQAKAAYKAGARFAVSPGLTQNLAAACADLALPLLPGVATGSEIMAAADMGFQALKFFPAVQAGGAAMLKAWGGPFTETVFCPTGGITPDNAKEFLSLPNVVCVGGSWLTPQSLIDRGDWASITELAQAATRLR